MPRPESRIDREVILIEGRGRSGGAPPVENPVNDLAGAGENYVEAAKLDGRSAGLQYNWGQCLLAQNDFTNARLKSVAQTVALFIPTEGHLPRFTAVFVQPSECQVLENTG